MIMQISHQYVNKVLSHKKIQILTRQNLNLEKTESALLLCDTLLSDHIHFQSAISTSTPCKLSLIPCCSDLCQAGVTFGGQGFCSIHTHRLFHLFIYFLCHFVFQCQPSSCRLPLHGAPNAPLLSHLDVLSVNLPLLASSFFHEHIDGRFHLSLNSFSTLSHFP